MTPEKKALALIRQRSRFLVVTHVNPDLDAIASQLALAAYLKGQGKRVMVVHEKPVSSAFCFLKAINQIRPLASFCGDYDAAIVVDCGELGRIGEVRSIIQDNKPILNIDHHYTNESFGTINIVDSSASSTAEVLFSLLQQWDADLSKEIAYYLYLGILTDTGSFRYQSTTFRTHHITAQLLKLGVDPVKIYRDVYEDLKPKHLFDLARIIQKVKYYRQGKIACVSLLPGMLKAHQKEVDLKDKIFSFLRMLKDVEVMVIFSQESTGKVRVNLRSAGSVNVAAIAQKFSGGGHKAASGCTLEQPLAKAQKDVLAQIFKKVPSHER